MAEGRLNFPAILVAAVVHQTLGALWYGAVFSKSWLALVGKPLEELQSAGKMPYAVAFFAALAMALTLAIVFRKTGTATAVEGALFGFLLGLALVVAPWVTNGLFEARPVCLSLIDSCYPALGLTLMGAILGAWRKP